MPQCGTTRGDTTVKPLRSQRTRSGIDRRKTSRPDGTGTRRQGDVGQVATRRRSSFVSEPRSQWFISLDDDAIIVTPEELLKIINQIFALYGREPITLAELEKSVRQVSIWQTESDD